MIHMPLAGFVGGFGIIELIFLGGCCVLSLLLVVAAILGLVYLIKKKK